MKTSKASFVVIFLFLFNSFSFCQNALRQGVYNLSGSISYSYSKQDFDNRDAKQYSFLIAPALNYFVIDNLLLGGNITFQYFESEYPTPFSTFKYIYRQFGIGPDIRYYFSGLDVFPFIGIEADYLKDTGNRREGYSFTAMAGINYFLSNSAAIEPYLSYTISSDDPDIEINIFSLGIRMNYFILN